MHDISDLARLKETIFALDLHAIKMILMSPEEGVGWTAEEVDKAEIQYKRFLFLSANMDDMLVRREDRAAHWRPGPLRPVTS
jgi:hypothetical protein